jgi:hypothetical protein
MLLDLVYGIRLLARSHEEASAIVALKVEPAVGGHAWVILHLLSCKAVVILRQGSPHARHFIIEGVGQKMDFEHLCQIVDTVVDLSVHSKRALLHDLAHRAAATTAVAIAAWATGRRLT